MQIGPNEFEITGSWVLSNGRITEDECCKRIEYLVASQLERVAVSHSGWETLYRDPNDGRYWEHYFPQGSMQGGGPPALRVVDPKTESIKQKFGI